MSDDADVFLIRVVQGEESLGTAFCVSLLMMAAFFAYDYYVPSFSDVFAPFFKFLHLFVITYALVAMHNSCAASGFMARMAARTYVLLLVAWATYTALAYYGQMGLIYPLVAWGTVFLLKEKEG